MKYSIAAAGLVALASAAPVAPVSNAKSFGPEFEFPLANGFPNPGPHALADVQKQAGGTLPNDFAPLNPGPTGLLDFQVIAYNEIQEVAFFSELLHNITTNVTGYEIPAADYSYVVETIRSIRAQEELHALGANAILEAFGEKAIQPCKYHYPVTTYTDAIALAATFTDLVLGALQGVEVDMANAQDAPIAQLIASIIGQEGEQTGWFRAVQQKVPSSAPFLTNTNGIFAYNALLQLFIVPGSCPQNLTAVPTFGALAVTNMPKAQNGTAMFEAAGTVAAGDYITYISGQNAPVTVAISNIKSASGATTFSAPFPYGGGFSRGLTLAAVTSSAGPFANSTEVALNTLFGPGLIEVN